MGSIKVLVNGANGKMGRAAVQAIISDPSLNLVGTADREHKLTDVIKSTQAEVVIDFTTADFAFANTKTILKSKAYAVIGTSGLTISDVEKLRVIARQNGVGGIVAPNFSLGAVLMMRYTKEIARYIPNVEIVEQHHEQKLDAPSGTAIRTAEMIAEVRGEKRLIRQVGQAEGAKEFLGARGAKYQNVNIHSLRLPGFIANQQVLFSAPGETLKISHETINRECFLPGICYACKKAPFLTDLIFGLENIID
jgi:4-hydroxy-tetrahydrodipicolinate reductase